MAAPYATVDPEVQEATKAALEHRDAYAARKSTSTRNPHSSRKGRSLKELMAMKTEERIITQWRTAYGCPISDEAKAQFSIQCLGHTFNLADVRLWIDKHQQRNGKEQTTDLVHLEFFFDGMLSEIQEDPACFEKAFADMIESQLQEKRVMEFRKKLSARKRTGTTRSATKTDCLIEGDEGGGAVVEDDSEWRSYLQRPVQPTGLSLRSMREAGCMLRFLVCQTSLSPSASEELGQIAFQEHFPIDGKEQEASTSTKPLPTWVYWMGLITAIFGLMMIVAFVQVFKAAAGSPASLQPP